LRFDETGLFFEAELPNTQHARDIYNLTESGLLDGMSFGFRTKDSVDESTMTRTITHIDELLEITITPFPAYKEASVIAQSSRKRENNIKKLEEALADE
jgi:phage prohead protease, HK97 family